MRRPIATVSGAAAETLHAWASPTARTASAGVAFSDVQLAAPQSSRALLRGDAPLETETPSKPTTKPVLCAA